MRRVARASAVLSFCLVLPFVWAQDGEPKEVEQPIKGFGKPVLILLPEDYSPKRKYGLVVFCHGTGGNGPKVLQWIRAKSKTQTEALLAAGYIAACPSSNTQAWGVVSYDKHPGGSKDRQPFPRMMEHLLSTYSIHPERVHMAGFSAGSVFLAKGLAWWDEFRGFKIRSIMCHSGGWNGAAPEARTDKAQETVVWVLNGSADAAHDAPSRNMCSHFKGAGYDARFTEVPGKDHIFPVIDLQEMIDFWTGLDGRFLKRPEYEARLREAREMLGREQYGEAHREFEALAKEAKESCSDIAEAAEKGIQQIKAKSRAMLRDAKALMQADKDGARRVLNEIREKFAGLPPEERAKELLESLGGE